MLIAVDGYRWKGRVVVLREGAVLDDALRARIYSKIRQDISPRHVPNEIFAVDNRPERSGKEREVPIRKVIVGLPLGQAANLDAMQNSESIRFFVELAQVIQKRRERGGAALDRPGDQALGTG